MTDLRVTQAPVEVLATRTDAPLRVTQLPVEVLVWNSLRPRYWVQVNWSDTETFPDMWNQVYTDLTTLGCIRGITVERTAEVGAGVVIDTAIVRVDDTAQHLEPGNADSLVYPNVAWGRRVRILHGYGGVIYPLFYGTVAEIANEAEQFPSQVDTFLTLESPLRAYLSLPVTPARIQDGWVYNSSDQANSALVALLEAAGIPSTQWSLDTGVYVPLDDWGGEERTVGDYLAELTISAGVLACVEPRYRTALNEVDWVFRWINPDAASVSFSWDAAAGDCNGLQVTYGRAA